MNKSNTKSNFPDEPVVARQEQSNTSDPSEEQVNTSPARNESELTSQLETLAKERDSLLDRLARAQAEFENSRKRMEKEQQDYRDFALADAMLSLLPALDSFDWALQTPVEHLQEFRSGLELIRKQVQGALEKLGLRPISAKGEWFDPRFHEAVDVIDTTDHPNDLVLEELRRGYTLGNRLLRPAMVLVANNSYSQTDRKAS